MMVVCSRCGQRMPLSEVLDKIGCDGCPVEGVQEELFDEDTRQGPGMEKKTTNEQCVHHWVIDEFNVGRCIKPGCGAVRDFGALLKKQGADIVQARVQSGKRGRKRR